MERLQLTFSGKLVLSYDEANGEQLDTGLGALGAYSRRLLKEMAGSCLDLGMMAFAVPVGSSHRHSEPAPGPRIGSREVGLVGSKKEVPCSLGHPHF